MTPGVVANVREVISSTLRSWIIESLEHFGVDSRVFLHVIQSILEQDVRSLRGEDALDDLWRCRLASVGSKRGGGRDPKRQMNEGDLRRCVLLENMRACFKEDEFDVAEEFVDELLLRWTEEARMNVEGNGGMKKSSQDLREEMDDEENKETKDPVREYNEAFPALGASFRASPANQTEHASSETTGTQNRNCAELLKELFYWNASSRNPANVDQKESMLGCTEERAKCCREVAKSMARDFVNSSVAANTQQNDSVRLCSNELLGRANVVPDLSRRFFANRLRATDVSAKSDFTVGSELAPEDSFGGRLSVPSSQSNSVQELNNSHLVEMSNSTCPTQGEGGSKFFPPLPRGVLSRTVERILSQSLQGLPCCHVPPGGGPNTGGASRGCIQCRSSGRLDFPIYTENEFGMLIRLGEDSGLGADERTNRKEGYGKRVIDASQLVVGVGEDASPFSADTLSTGAMEKIAEEEVHPSLSSGRGLPRPVLPDRRSSEVKGGHPYGATSGWKGAEVVSSMHQADQQQKRDEIVGSCSRSCDHSSAALGPDLFFCRFNRDAVAPESNLFQLNTDGQCLTRKTQPPTPSHSKIIGSVGTAPASQLKPLEPNDFQCSGEIGEMPSHRCRRTASEDDSQGVIGMDLADASMLVGSARPQPNIMSRNAEQSSSATVSCPLGSDGAFASSSRVAHSRDSSSAVSCETVLRLLADVIERDLMNHIAASLIPLFPDQSTPQDLFLPDAEMLAHIAVQNCIRDPNCSATVGGNAFRAAATCENDYALYLHLAVREDSLHVDHVLNFQDFCRWRQCLLQQTGSDNNVSCVCDLCHRARKRHADSRYAFVDVNAARLEASRKPVADSERESLLAARSEHNELQSEKQGPEKRHDSGSNFSSKPALVMNACLQNSSAGTGDFTGKFDGIMMNKVPAGKDGNYGCSSVGEGDVLQQKHSGQIDNVGVFGRNSLREIWPYGDADRKLEERCGLKEHFEENNNVLESFGCLPETGFSWLPLSQGVAVGNSVDIWLNSSTSSLVASATSCKKPMSAMKSCDKTVLPDIASDKSISVASKYNAFDFGASAANVCDKIASVATICNKSSNTCKRSSLPAGFCDQSALITNSLDESVSTAGSCHNWFCTDIAETVTAATSSVASSESKLECLSPSIRTLEKLLSSDEERSSSVESFQSALHEDFYSLWLNASPTHGHESGPLCAEETSSDSGSQLLGSDDDALHNSEAHYEADISSSDSSVDEGSLRGKASDMQKSRAKKQHLSSDAHALFGLSFSMPSEPSSFSPVAIEEQEDIVSTKHSRFQSSQSSVDSSDATNSSESDLSKPYSADCNSCSGEHLASAEECKVLLSDWELRRPHLESYEGPTADCYQAGSEDLEDPTLYKNWEDGSSENFVRIIPSAWDVNLPESGNLTGLTFSCGQQEVVNLEQFEKLKPIWDESQLDNFKDLTADHKPQESGSIKLSETFSQLNIEDVKRQLPSSDLECSASEKYRKLASLWDTDQAKVESFSGVTAFLEDNDMESSSGLAPSWNQRAPEFEHASGMTPDWNMNEHAQENSKVLKIDWNEQEPQRDGAEAGGVRNWNILHQPSAESCTDLTSCWSQQQSRVENLKGPTLGCEMVRSVSENLTQLTDKCDAVGEADNFEEIESIWVGNKSSECLKGGKRQVNQIQGDNSVALLLDSNQQESESGNLKKLASLKSLWEEEEPRPASSDDLKVAWDLKHHLGSVGLASSCGHQTADLGSCKDLRELKSIWEEKEPCTASSKGIEQNWEMNQMGGNVRNAREVQQTWDGNQTESDNCLETSSNCDKKEVDSRNVQNLVELRFIWEDAPQKSDNLKGMTSCCKPESTAHKKKLMPSSDNNQLNAEHFLELGATRNDHQAANLENSIDARFLWEVDRHSDENPDGLTSNWKQQEPGTENTTRPESSSLHAASDLENCLLLTSIWEMRPSESGRSSGWEVLESSRSDGNATETTISTCDDTNHKAGAEGARNDVGDFQNLAQTLWKEEQKNLESLVGAIWDMNPNDGEKGVGLAYNCRPQENQTEGFQNLTQLESLWGERESNLDNLRDANWDMEPSETKKLVKLEPGQDQEDVGPADSFQNLKSIWDEKLPDSGNDVRGLMLDWDVNPTDDDAQYATRLTPDEGQQETDPGNFQNLAQLKSIWEEKEPNVDSSKGAQLNWDINRMETQHAVVVPSCPNQQETDPANFLNLSEVKSIWEGKQSSSENLEKLASCWENPAPELENITWDTSQQTSENLTMLNSSVGQQVSDCRNLKSIWEGQQPAMGNLEGPTSCWKQQAVKSEILRTTGTSNWNATNLNSESFDNSLFDLNCRKSESENFGSVMSSHGDIKQSNSEIFLDRKLPEPKCFRRPTSDRELRYREFGGLGTSNNSDLWQSDSDELKQMISSWDKQQTESRGIRGLFSHFDSQQSNLAAEWQLAEAVEQLKTSDDATNTSLWRLTGRNPDSVLPKLVPSENSAFQDEIPRRFVYRYAFFDPRDVCDLATKDARTETIRHIYEPSNSIVRQLEDLFDDGQRLHTEEAPTNLPNCLFRPIGEQNSGRDSHQSVATSVGFATDTGDLSLQIKSPSTDPSEEVLEPNSPYQLYLGVESQTFVPRFRVHKELEKSAQTGEATPPMQNNECVFGMNVILSTIALLE